MCGGWGQTRSLLGCNPALSKPLPKQLFALSMKAIMNVTRWGALKRSAASDRSGEGNSLDVFVSKYYQGDVKDSSLSVSTVKQKHKQKRRYETIRFCLPTYTVQSQEEVFYETY